MHDGFTLVKKKWQKKQKPKFLKQEISFESEDIFNGKLKKALEEFESSRLCFELLQTINTCLTIIGLDVIEEVLCYGIGNFAESKSSLHQLAALIKINTIYNSSVIVYDPVFTSFEITALKKLNFKVLSENEEGKRKISGSQISIIFLPHCPKQLTNNFLWANWNTSLCRCILIGNSFSKIIQNSTKKDLQESASYIANIYPKTEEISLEDSYHIENIFNDTSVHYFKSKDLNSNFFKETLKEEPQYSSSEVLTNEENAVFYHVAFGSQTLTPAYSKQIFENSRKIVKIPKGLINFHNN